MFSAHLLVMFYQRVGIEPFFASHAGEARLCLIERLFNISVTYSPCDKAIEGICIWVGTGREKAMIHTFRPGPMI